MHWQGDTMILHRVNGPPGCGKTTYLADQCNVAAEKYGAGAVVVCSLTKAAALEVASRKTALPDRNVGTLHSHAYHTLNRPAIAETSKGFKDWNEWCPTTSWRISNKHAADPENAEMEQNVMDSDGIGYLNAANVFRQRMTPQELWPMSVRRFYLKWCEWKALRSYTDFTDLIERALDETTETYQQPAVLMFDEAQDMSRLEMALAMKWGEACQQVVIVGDQDQNLYQWRGSDPEAFVHHEASTVRTLSQSYRVPVAVHDVAVKWIEQVVGRERTKYAPRLADDGTSVEGNLRSVGLSFGDPGPLLASILLDVERGKSVMVLGSCGYMVSPLVTELKARGVPFHNPYRLKHGGWNPMRGAHRLLAWTQAHEAPKGEARLWTWKDIHRWMAPMQSKGALIRGSKTYVEAKCQVDRFGDGPGDDTVSIVDIKKKLLTDEGFVALMDGDIDWWEAHLKHEERKRAQYALTVARRSGFEKLREKPQIIVGTIHSVKGGQADVVYLFPDLSNAAYFEGWSRPGPGKDAIIRQFYVGMTRAREELVLCAPSGAERVVWPTN